MSESVPNATPKPQWMSYREGVYGPAQEGELREFTERFGCAQSDESGVANVVFRQMWSEIDRLRAQLSKLEPRLAYYASCVTSDSNG